MDVATGPAAAPGDLELVRKFVNTRDIEAGDDCLLTSAEVDVWAHAHGLALPVATPAEVAQLKKFREGLRAVLLVHHNNYVPEPATLEIIDRAMEWGGVRPALSAQGLGWSANTGGTAGLVGQVLRLVVAAMIDGTWLRLKICDNDTCQWAFYDHSRSRTGRWCSMQVCGNRNKQQRFRGKAGST